MRWGTRPCLATRDIASNPRTANRDERQCGTPPRRPPSPTRGVRLGYRPSVELIIDYNRGCGHARGGSVQLNSCDSVRGNLLVNENQVAYLGQVGLQVESSFTSLARDPRSVDHCAATAPSRCSGSCQRAECHKKHISPSHREGLPRGTRKIPEGGRRTLS